MDGGGEGESIGHRPLRGRCPKARFEHRHAQGLFLLVTIAILMGHSVARYVRSLTPLTPLTPLTCSAALHLTALALLTCSVHGLTHSLRSLPRGTVKFMNIYMLKIYMLKTQSFVRGFIHQLYY